MNARDPLFTRRTSFGLVPLLAVLGLAGALFAAAGVGPAPPAGRIGVVDLEQVMTRSSAGRELAAHLAAFQAQVERDLVPLSERCRAIRERIIEMRSEGDEKQLLELESSFKEALGIMQDIQQAKLREGEQMRDAGLAEIERSLEPVYARLIDGGAYDLILDRGAVLGCAPQVDLTGEVLRLLEE